MVGTRLSHGANARQEWKPPAWSGCTLAHRRQCLIRVVGTRVIRCNGSFDEFNRPIDCALARIVGLGRDCDALLTGLHAGLGALIPRQDKALADGKGTDMRNIAAAASFGSIFWKLERAIVALPGKTELAEDRAPLDEVLQALDGARVALKRFRQSPRVEDRRELKQAAKAFKKVLSGTCAEADLLLKTWMSIAENDGNGKDRRR